MYRLFVSSWIILIIVPILAVGSAGNNYGETYGTVKPDCRGNASYSDEDRLRFALNLEFMEAEFFLNAALGVGLDFFNKTLAKGGPPPIGAMKADLDPVTNRIIEEFGFQEIGHVRAISDMVGGIPRPLLNLSRENFADVMDRATGRRSHPRFDPYANTINYLLASYVIPYVGLNGYVGTIPFLIHFHTKQLTAGLLAPEAGQDAIIRTLLYEHQNDTVKEYGGITVAELTNDISFLRNTLGMCGIKDEGLVVPPELGAENRTTSNILSLDAYSLAYARTPQEVLRIVHGTGDEHLPGGFLPCGGNGRIARDFLNADYYDPCSH